MAKLRAKKHFLSIRYKIIAVIYIVLFPVLVLTSIVVFIFHYNTTRNEVGQQRSSSIQSVSSYIEFLERDINDLTLFFSVNPDIYRLLSEPNTLVAEDPLFWINQAQTNSIRYLITLQRHIQTIILYPENGLPPFFLSKDASVHDTNIENIRDLPIYQTAADAMGDIVFSRVNAGESGLFIVNRDDKIVFCRTLYDFSKNRKLGFIAISVDVSWYERICRNALLNENDSILILNSDRSVLASVGDISDEALAHVRSQEYRNGSRTNFQNFYGQYIFSSENTDNGKQIYYFTPRNYILSQVFSGLILPVVLSLVLLICVLPLSFLFSKIVTRPLYRLYHSMNKFKEGDFDQQVEVKGSDEIAELSGAFNRMVKDLSDLIDRNYVMVLHEREIELNALQAQINPHFLYNALDALYWQAVDSEMDNLAEDVLAISELFRLLLSRGESEITVERELAIISKYLHIQKMRFSKKISYEIDVDEKLHQQMIPKLVLQPFVENAVVHGLEKKDTWGYINIKGIIENDVMVFTIEDNGAGMSRETLNEILSTEKRYTSQRISSFAIRNVMERMSLKYDSHYKLDIESELGVGSKIRISLPLDFEDRAE